MARQCSIYNKIENPHLRGACSFGASGGFKQDIMIGSGSSNSHTLAAIEVAEHWDNENKAKTFTLWINGELIRKAVYKDGQAQVDWVL